MSMDQPRGSTEGVAPLQVRLLEAREVSIPIAVTHGGTASEPPPEVMKLRADFLAGKELSRDQMGELMRQSAETSGAGNGNCNIC
jgi:hypothetical protein